MTGPAPNYGMQIDSDRLTELINAYSQAADAVLILRADLANQGSFREAWAHDPVSDETYAHYNLQAINGPASTLHALDEWQRELRSIQETLTRMAILYQTNESNIAVALPQP